MAGLPVYKLFYARFNELYRNLPDGERAALDRRDQEALATVGGKTIILCESRWCSEQWDGWGVEQFPSVEILQEYTRMQASFGWHRYYDGMSMLGTPWPGYEEPHTVTQPILKVFQAHLRNAFHQLSDADHAQLLQRVDGARDAAGGKLILFCEARWQNEQWDAWGVEEFPSVEAVQEQSRLLAEIGWQHYHDSVSLLGTRWQG